MKTYYFETYYTKEGQLNPREVLIKIASYFLNESSYCDFEAVSYKSNDTFVFEGMLGDDKDKVVKDILETLRSENITVNTLLINDNLIKNDRYKFELRDSVSNWLLYLSLEEFEQFQKYLIKNKLPSDLFFPEEELIKVPISDFLTKIFDFLGWSSQAWKGYTPLEYKNKKEK